MGAGLGAFLSLLRWLGPWTPETRVPSGVSFRDIDLGQGLDHGHPNRLRIFAPVDRPTHGALYVMPGVHHEGAADPRMMRFCSVLANAGILVGSPFIPDLVDLRLTEGAVEDTVQSMEAFLSIDEFPAGVQPGAFCISTASILGIYAAADLRLRERLGGLVLFGGFADWSRSLRFMLTGGLPNGDQIEPDPLNQSVVFLNMIPWLPVAPEETGALKSLWTRFVHATWEKPEMLVDDRYLDVARALSAEAAPEWRELFEMGTTLRPGGLEILEQALEAWKGPRSDWLDPTEKLAHLACPIYLVHGREDVVIPWTEAAELEAKVPARIHAGTWVTGFYDHTGHTGVLRQLLRLPLLPLELWRSVGIVRAFVRAAGFRTSGRG
jgi:pimeloyl-ACP methyl ester carboxylesterase